MSDVKRTYCHNENQSGSGASGAPENQSGSGVTGAPEDRRQSDVLNTFHQFSNDEVITPLWIAQQILDTLPDEVWSNPDLKWLDIGCKSGVFLREAALRLKNEFMRLAEIGEAVKANGQELLDETQIVDHILGEMLYGVATTALMAKVSRRVLYSSVDATHPVNSAARRVEHFTSDGNIRFKRDTHRYSEEGRCRVCGYSKEKEDSMPGTENYAYELIHADNPQELYQELFKDKEGNTVKFDVVIGNPPYQMATGGGRKLKQAKPIYPEFVYAAKALKPSYMAMIIPGRWFAHASMGLPDFRDNMVSDGNMVSITDYPEANEVFPDNGISGGVMYFLWDSQHQGLCRWTTVSAGERDIEEDVDLAAVKGVVLRSSAQRSVLKKVLEVHGEKGKFVGPKVSAINPFFKDMGHKGTAKKTKRSVEFFEANKVTWFDRSKIEANSNLIDRHKVLIGKAGTSGLTDRVTAKPFYAAPGSACSETYLVVGDFDTKEKAENMVTYMKTKFFRYMVLMRKSSQNMAKGTYDFAPEMCLDTVWTDANLYKHFGLTQDEIDHIEATVKGMP